MGEIHLKSEVSAEICAFEEIQERSLCGVRLVSSFSAGMRL